MPFHHQGAVPAQLPPPSSAPPSTSPSLSDTQKGVDPSFLAALPDDLRVMVIEEEEKMRRAVEGLAPPAQMVQVSQLSTLGCSRDNKDAIWRANSK